MSPARAGDTTSKARLRTKNAAASRCMPYAVGKSVSTFSRISDPGMKKSCSGTPETAFRTGKPNCSIAKSLASSMATTVPPSVTYRLSAAAPSTPSPPVYSGGIWPGACPVMIPLGDWLGTMMTSYRLRSPFRMSASCSVSHGNSDCSNTHRVQPSSMFGTQLLYRPTRGERSW